MVIVDDISKRCCKIALVFCNTRENKLTTLKATLLVNNFTLKYSFLTHAITIHKIKSDFNL